MSPWLFKIHMDGAMKEGSEIPEVGESGDCQAFCMQMTWFYVVSWRRT